MDAFCRAKLIIVEMVGCGAAALLNLAPSQCASSYCNLPCRSAILVSMTRKSKTPPTSSKPLARGPRLASRPWPLQDAKARFSELVRRVHSEGPQHVTVHGRDEVVVITAEEFRRLKGDQKGDALVAVLQASPHRDVELAPSRSAMPVRMVDL
jgi:prevent-host-death family protein